jgi:SAM-dependent methyltransferase
VGLIERIDAATPVAQRWGHEARYRLAAGYLEPGDLVLDAACGTGYGAQILNAHRDVRYLGLDRVNVFAYPDRGAFLLHDLNAGDLRISDPDVAVCFETLEHLRHPAHLVSELCAHTRRTLLMSVPVVPTTHVNPYHLHDFDDAAVPAMVAATGQPWTLTARFDQPAELAAVYVFERHG